jgi:hypothetical protein
MCENFYASFRHSDCKFFEASKNPHNSTVNKVLPHSPGSSAKTGRCFSAMGAATKSPDIGDNRLQPYRSHLGNATPKGGLAFFWESFIIIFLKNSAAGTLCCWDTLLLGHSAAGTLCSWDTLLLGHSAAGTLCCWDTLLLGHSAPGTLCSWDTLLLGHSAPRTLCSWDTLLLGHSAPGTLCSLDTLPLEHYMLLEHYAPRTLCS